MKRLAVSILTILLSFIFISTVNAVEANIQLDSKTDTSATISWDAFGEGYYVYLGTVSGEYNLFTSELLLENTYEITDLVENQDYFVSVIGLTAEGEETDYAPELSFRLGEQTLEEFKLTEVTPLYKDRISLSFTTPLMEADEESREFIIKNSQDEFIEIEVTSSKIDEGDNKKLILELAEEMEVDQEYMITIISLSDTNGQVITSGIDSIETFYVSNEVQTYDPNMEVEVSTGETVEEVDEIGQVEEVVSIEEIDQAGSMQNEEDLELNAANNDGELNTANNDGELNAASDDENDAGNEEDGGLAGLEISDEELANDTLSAANQVESLPQTGPEHVLIFILTFILGTLVFVLRSKKI